MSEKRATTHPAHVFVPEASELAGRYEERRVMAEQYIEAYRRYRWTVHSLADLKLAPFHLLASEGWLHSDKDHVWHMTTLARLCAVDPGLLLATPYKLVKCGLFICSERERERIAKKVA